MDIAVFITSYNQKAYLKEAIDSVLAQTLRPSQIVIVDDCSSDGSQALIKGYQARHPDLITPVWHTQNRGVAPARASALRAVKSTYVTYLDGDDRYLPAKLEKESALLASHPSAQIVYANNHYMNEDGRRYATWVTDRQPPQGEVFKETLTRSFPRGNLFRMELLPYALWQEVGFHDPALKVLEDWEMRIRLTNRYRVAYVDEALSEYRVHSGGLSNLSAAEKLSAFDYIWRKHKPALATLSPADRKLVAKKMDQLRATFMRRQAKEALGAYGQISTSSRAQAWDYYRRSWGYDPSLDLDLLAGMLLPTAWYRRLRDLVRPVAGRGAGG
jgi:glycosyltransferase involved in cell wall biosynthesis